MRLKQYFFRSVSVVTDLIFLPRFQSRSTDKKKTILVAIAIPLEDRGRG
jgi:hypothetical protein